MGTEKEDVENGGGCGVGHGLNEEAEELAFHAGDRMRHGGEGVKTFF